MLSGFTNLPKPIQALTLLAGGAGVVSVGMAFWDRSNPFWMWLAIGIASVAVLVALYILILKLKDKSKSGPFASLIAKAGGGRGAVDPAQKARMDDLRKKFEEGVSAFKSAGKDLYSLPWFLLVGPSGSGKTEAMRHCNVGFPPGLQDCLQGTGGTMNMHWWFTNQAVVLDTAGRMFMEEGSDNQATEWKEFMKLLKDCRPNAPINGLLLVISAESLLKDTADKIEKTAGAIARQLDVVQRTLDVRFPVFVLVTKCDKIVGFRDFFETLNDPALQHQILGWSNPAPLDEVFKPEQVDQHLSTVRTRLMRRRMGLLQNPIHTSDPSARRTDQVDEMFELPDNLMRIAPRLRRYLEMIFVAGEWSPKPLFLRGIYFTSSMREGQALDVSLAEALGIDVESIPGGKEWDKDKAYFLRDTFMNKVFKERGLVTRAANVSKALAKQRRMILGVSGATVVVVAGIAVLGWFQFKSSLGPPSRFWSEVRTAYAGDAEGEKGPLDIELIKSADGKTWTYAGNRDWEKKGVLEDDRLATPAELVLESAAQTRKEIKPPLIAAPIVGWSSSWSEEQVRAHRAVVERAVVVPLVQATRSKLMVEKKWGPEAVGALGQLLRLQTYALGAAPADNDPGTKPVKGIDADVLFRYVLSREEYGARTGFGADREKLVKAVADAYPDGWDSRSNKPAEVLGGADRDSIMTMNLAVDELVKHLLALGASEGSKMAHLTDLLEGLSTFRDEEVKLLGLEWFRSGADAKMPQTLAEYTLFEAAFLNSTDKIADSRTKIDGVAKALGPAMDDVPGLLKAAGDDLQKEMAAYFAMLRAQLPVVPEGDKASGVAKELAELRSKLDEKSQTVDAAVRTKLEQMTGLVKELAPMVAGGRADRADARAYAARAEAYKLAADDVKTAAQPLAAPVDPAVVVSEVPPTLASQVELVDRNVTTLSAAIAAWGAWVPDAGQQPTLASARDSSVGLSRKAVEIARSRRLNELARKTIDGWPRDPGSVSKRVQEVGTGRINEGTFRRVMRPRLPLSEMESGGEFSREYHPEAAKEVFGDWAKLRELIEPASSGVQRAVIGRDELRADRAYRLSADATSEFAKDYLRYWRAQAVEASRPNKATWSEFGDRLKAAPHFEIKSELQALHDTVKQAIGAVPASAAWNDALTAATNEFEAAFTGLSKAPFMDETKLNLSAWAKLVDLGPAKARDTLLDSLRREKIKDEYFSVYRADSLGLKYWNDLIINGLTCLVRETQGELEAAKDGLVKDARGAPLVFGPSDLRDLSPAAVKKIKGWADKLDALAGSDRSSASAESLPVELKTLMLRLAGADIFPDPLSRQWFGKLRNVARIMGQDKPLGVLVNYPTEYDRPRRVGLVDDVRDNYRYAALRVGGLARGPVFSLLNPIDEARQKDLRIDLPLADGQTSEVYLYKQDPGLGGMDAPDAKIVLPGNWSLLRQMVIESGEAQRDEKTGLWKVLLTTPDGKMYLWLTLRFDQELPLPSEWPRVEQWPTP
jgi:GTP-binding protein EngB required for normal cell division